MVLSSRRLLAFSVGSNLGYYYVLRVARGGGSDEASAQAQTTDIATPSVTFDDHQLARACAGGIAGDDVHSFTLVGTAKRENEEGQEEIVPAGTAFKLSFENNRGHNYGNGSAPKQAKFVTTDANGHPAYVEELPVTTNAQGHISLSVLSSDIISSDIKVKIKWQDADGEEQDAGSKACVFARARTLRRFGLANFPDEEDTGWIFNQDALLSYGITPVKVYLKFRVNLSIPEDTNRFDADGRPLNGNQLSDIVTLSDLWMC